MATFVNPFDFVTIFITLFSGNSTLFTFIGVLIISIAMAFMRVPDKIYLPMLVLFGVFFLVQMNQNAIYILLLLITGIVTFKVIARIVT